jgi:hypothetical protein
MVNITEIMRSAIFHDCYSQPLLCSNHGNHIKTLVCQHCQISKTAKENKVKGFASNILINFTSLQ